MLAAKSCFSRRPALASQLLARKSIDKLISDSEEPGHALKKTLDELSDWMEHGFKRPEKEQNLFGS